MNKIEAGWFSKSCELHTHAFLIVHNHHRRLYAVAEGKTSLECVMAGWGARTLTPVQIL